MSSRRVEWNGTLIALLVHDDEGGYLVPPVVLDPEDNVVMGLDVLEAIRRSGRPIEVPVVRNCTPGQLAELDQRLARVRDELGVAFVGL